MRLGRFPLDGVQRTAIAQAGLQQALRIVAHDTAETPQIDTLQEPWATGRVDAQTTVFEDMPLGDGMFSVGRIEQETFVPGLIDEERKLPLNVAAPEHLRRLFELIQPEGVDPQALAEAIVDWRDEPSGAVCAAADPPCHNGPFESVQELRLVPGMTAAAFEAIAPYVTVYGSGAVNVNTASAMVLNAMGYPGDELVEQRKTQPFTAYPGLAVTSSAFTVPVQATLANRSIRLQLVAIVDRTGTILSWSTR